MISQESRWNFFTNHAHILIYLEAHPDQTLRRVALAIGITERAVQRIVAELEEGGYLKRAKVGRQNKYEINGDTPLRHSQESHRSVKELLDWVKSLLEILRMNIIRLKTGLLASTDRKFKLTYQFILIS